MILCSAFWYLAVIRAAVRRRRSASLLLLQEPLPGQVQGSPRPEAPLPLGPGAHLVFDLEAGRGKKWVDLHDSSSEILFSVGKNTLTHVGRAAPPALMPDSIYLWLSCKWESKAAFPSLNCSIICFNVPSSSLLAFSLKNSSPDYMTGCDRHGAFP